MEESTIILTKQKFSHGCKYYLDVNNAIVFNNVEIYT